MTKPGIGVACALATLFITSSGYSQTKGSASYTFLYTVTASSGQPAQSANYAANAAVVTAGAATKAASSANYTYTPVIGLGANSTSQVADWQLY